MSFMKPMQKPGQPPVDQGSNPNRDFRGMKDGKKDSGPFPPKKKVFPSSPKGK